MQSDDGTGLGGTLTAALQQIAVVRTLADELERRLVRAAHDRGVSDQLCQELARLGRHCLQLAGDIEPYTED